MSLSFPMAMNLSVSQLKEKIIALKGVDYLPGGCCYPPFKFVDAGIENGVLVPGRMDYVIAAVTASDEQNPQIVDMGENDKSPKSSECEAMYDPTMTPFTADTENIELKESITLTPAEPKIEGGEEFI
jgi:hypothetical protein